ncbi:NAD(P)-dependent oxidoreductase [Streptomyces hyaluromycini]|uniref:NAD(P)-dependent oxidoreductase n=1 Tax=Streptomyces hyaluromycini TaxID=1377993 RepID=UPI001237E1D5|nr:NAD(P)-dependent oxidoreductase [Streptomyces hyaluromycini]
MNSTAVAGLRIAVLGLGEAGGAIAGDLVAAGALVRGYDPKAAAPPGVVGTGGEAESAAGSDLVLSVNSASAAPDALRAGLAGTAPGCLWADLNTASPAVKRHLGAPCGLCGLAEQVLPSRRPGRPSIRRADSAGRCRRRPGRVWRAGPRGPARRRG